MEYMPDNRTLTVHNIIITKSNVNDFADELRPYDAYAIIIRRSYPYILIRLYFLLKEEACYFMIKYGEFDALSER
jgi:hypothetical protein